jgi:hypothetical protein
MESIFGGLIEFENQDEFDNFMLSINKENALKIIEKSIEFAYQNNMFSVQETYCIYKSLRKLKDNNE